MQGYSQLFVSWLFARDINELIAERPKINSTRHLPNILLYHPRAHTPRETGVPSNSTLLLGWGNGPPTAWNSQRKPVAVLRRNQGQPDLPYFLTRSRVDLKMGDIRLSRFLPSKIKTTD